MASLEVLHLLADPLQLFRRRDYVLLNQSVARLAADGVGFAQHLLENETQSLADWLGCPRLSRFAERRQVRAETIQFLRYVHLVGENRDLLGNPLRISTGAADQFRDGPLNSLVLLLETDWSALFDSRQP